MRICVELNHGLANQLTALFNGIIIAHVLGRDVCFRGFLKDYNNSRDLVEVERILDIPSLKEVIVDLKLRTDIVLDFDVSDFTYPSGDRMATMNMSGELIDLLTNEENRNRENVIVYFPFHFFLEEHGHIKRTLIERFRFHGAFYDIVERHIPPGNFKCLHLRLEDDVIVHWSSQLNRGSKEVSLYMMGAYDGILRQNFSKEDEIFVCSALDKSRNLNDYYLKDLKRRYRIIKTDRLYDDIPINGREVCAIIDFLIALKATRFVGVRHSSFSRLVKKKRSSMNKESIIIKIPQIG